MSGALAGIFVGGAGRRMGGVAKGLMQAPQGGTLVERWLRLLVARGLEVVLVGSRAEYQGLGLELVPDAPPGIGPLGGLVALLQRAAGRTAIALACDMPFVSGALVDRLRTESPEAPILAPRRDGRWEPLCARYDPARVLEPAKAMVAEADHGLQRLLERAGAVALALQDHEQPQLRDWDSPHDL